MMSTIRKSSTKSSLDNSEEIQTLRARVTDLEKQVSDYKSRLDVLRKAKNNYIVKKEKEYVEVGLKQTSRESDAKDIKKLLEDDPVPTENSGPCKNCEFEKQRSDEYEKVVQALSNEMDDAKSLIEALRVENEEVKKQMESNKKQFQVELAAACFKEEEAMREVKKWEQSYKEWMSSMETRVGNLMRTNEMLQRCIQEQDASNRNNS